jgi:hypothetical protein
MIYKMHIELTLKGLHKVYAFISDLEIKLSELINAGYADEDDETSIPDIEDIKDDILTFVDKDGMYYNGWNATENSEPDILELHKGVDFTVN